MSHVTLKFILTKQVKNPGSKPSFLSHTLNSLFLSFHNLEGKLGKKNWFVTFFHNHLSEGNCSIFHSFFLWSCRIQTAKPEITTIPFQESPTPDALRSH